MDQVHMVSALTWSPDFDLNERMEEIRSDLGEVGWEELEEKMILNTSKAALGLDIYRSEAKAIQEALKESPEVLGEAARYLMTAARFLRERCKVYGPGTLPYSFQVVLLAEAIRVGTEGLTKELSSEQLDRLQRWFWMTTYTEYFASMSATRLRKALEHLRRVVMEGLKPEPPDLPTKVDAARRFDFRAARSRAIALRMADLDPRGLDGPVEDPYQLLAEHGRNATPMIFLSRAVGNRPLAEGAENRIVAHPRDAAELRRELREGASSLDPVILRSHAIDEDAAEALSAGDVVGFLRIRRQRLLEIEKDFVEPLGLEYVGDEG
jgi:hypothetical protein